MLIFSTEERSVSNAYNVSELGLNLPMIEVEKFTDRYVIIFCSPFNNFYALTRYVVWTLINCIFVLIFCSLPKDDLPLTIVESKYAAIANGVSDKDDFFTHTPRKTIAQMKETKHVSCQNHSITFRSLLCKLNFQLIYISFFFLIIVPIFCLNRLKSVF